MSAETSAHTLHPASPYDNDSWKRNSRRRRGDTRPAGLTTNSSHCSADWRAFEQPPLRDGAPDYTAETFARRHKELRAYRDRLAAIKPDRWPVAQQVDYHVLRAEMNGFDFYVRVLKPWERDPAFYLSIWMEQSDTPAHEGPTNHAAIELWTYSFPLTSAAEAKLTRELRTVPPLLTQARRNLVGDARDLWVAGVRPIKRQDVDLAAIEQKTANNGAELRSALQAARKATTGFVSWLEQQAPSKTGPSGIGKENYTWSLRNVHLVPLSWEDEVMLLKRELARAHTSLKFEEERNRGLPDLPVISSPQEYERRANEAVTKYMAFLKKRNILPMRDYMDPALARAPRRVRARGDAQFFRDRDTSRADDAIHALLSLVGPGSDARIASCEPDPARPIAVQHLGQSRRRHGDIDGRDDVARRSVRRQSARP